MNEVVPACAKAKFGTYGGCQRLCHGDVEPSLQTVREAGRAVLPEKPLQFTYYCICCFFFSESFKLAVNPATNKNFLIVKNCSMWLKRDGY